MDNLRVYLSTMLELEIAEKQGDAGLADSLRDQMDDYWYAMSGQEQVEAREAAAEMHNI